jgi:site-specific DNA-cytosine methylase
MGTSTAKRHPKGRAAQTSQGQAVVHRTGARAASQLFDELLVDNFAGGGGASTGIERALGRAVDVAINHDQEAVAVHRANHPATKHLCQDVFDVDPVAVTEGRPVGVAWFSPDCTYFSKARGAKPIRDVKRRDLAWVVIRWARAVRPRVILLENVEEFRGWGPLVDGRPCPARRGETFEQWLAELRGEGYEVEWRELRAHDYGAPTVRKRLFLIARSRTARPPSASTGRSRARRSSTARGRSRRTRCGASRPVSAGSCSVRMRRSRCT